MKPREEPRSASEGAPPPNRRQFLKWAAAAGGVAALGAWGGSLLFRETPGNVPDTLFLTKEEADGFLGPQDIVFGLEYKGAVKAYPQRVLVWHEIMNDTLGGGESLAITYCPLTGSQIAYQAEAMDPAGPPASVDYDAFNAAILSGGVRKDGIPAIDNSPLTFGTSGNLVNSNLLMYDRQTGSQWPQILGTAINGPRRGETLEEVPLVWTTWGRWSAKHPQGLVLGTRTGHVRNYSVDPYGVYDPEPRRYYGEGGSMFPVMNESDRFHPKKVTFGLKQGGQQMAIPLEDFRTVGAKDFSLANTPLAAFYDASLDTLRVFRRTLEGDTLSFAFKEGKIVDRQTDSTWSPEGRAIEGPSRGAALPQVNAYNVMWFAWYAFYPKTQVLV